MQSDQRSLEGKAQRTVLDHKVGNTHPSLHVRLEMFFRLRIIQLQCAQTCTSHEEEGDILYIVNILGVRVLKHR